ncbi:cuticle-degrading serine protease [Lingula anatina]|uniref:Cuticle-degrading serine protease n=1 Tax=Lingula anatina TaxID=7574 RepID=A0A1S3IIB3_LINAN|nr:cuticle-degrading serine protease [Lingula anatina]|eukprot:XP_013397621.1 cuticle-degrading serine protease [Lingula anatina]
MTRFLVVVYFLVFLPSSCVAGVTRGDVEEVQSLGRTQRGALLKIAADDKRVELQKYTGDVGIPDSYILKLKNGTGIDQASDFINSIKDEMPPDLFDRTEIGEPGAVGQLRYLMVKTTEEGIEWFRLQTDIIDSIYQDTYVYSAGCTCNCHCENGTDLDDGACWSYFPENWGLDRIDQASTALDGKFNIEGTGSDVDVYVFDTGIYREHIEFLRADGTSRVTLGNIANASWSAADVDGHGTHVAGLIGGKTVGVAKNVSLISVKVLGDDGFGSDFGIIAMLSWVQEQVQATQRKSIVNLSLGGEKSEILNDAVNALFTDAGVLSVVAAGNENVLSKYISPASATHAFTVGATQHRDKRATFSNYGSDVDIWAPGEDLGSSSNEGVYRYRLSSGTSMACPLVAGAAAVYMSSLDYNPTPSEVKDHLISTSQDNVVTGIPEEFCSDGICEPAESVTRLLQVGCSFEEE